jgi:hypothetical protein
VVAGVASGAAAASGVALHALRKVAAEKRPNTRTD